MSLKHRLQATTLAKSLTFHIGFPVVQMDRFPNFLTPMLRRQERHNEGTLTALMSTESLVQQDGCDNHTHEGKPARAYNITQCRRHCLLVQPLLPRK